MSAFRNLAAAAALAIAAASPAAALVIEAKFDAVPDGVISAPFVGEGTVSFTETPGQSLYNLGELADLEMTFVFGDIVFTENDVLETTPLSTVQMLIEDTPNGLAFRFAGGTDGFGALELGVGGEILAFEPEFGGEFYRGRDGGEGPTPSSLETTAEPTESYFGEFGPAAQVPLPPAAAGLLAGLGALGLAARRRRRA